MKRRVVVTGLGVISSLGLDYETFWSSLIEGKSGISLVSSFDTSDYETKIGAEVKDFDPYKYMDKKDVKRTDRFAQFAIAAAKQATADANLEINEENANRVGVLIGSGIGGMRTFEDQARTFIEKGPRRVSPFFIPMMIADMATGQVSIYTGARGPNLTAVTACASSTHAIGEAFRIIQYGDADVMITGGSEAAITGLAYAGFSAAGALSKRNEEPTRASRPFDLERDGFVMGEGAAVIILEELESALARGAKIYAEIVGYGLTGDAYHVTAPHPAGIGAAEAMRMAVKDAGWQPEQVDYINAHGTSTKQNDEFETLAIKKVFGEHAYRLAVSSTKSMTGHLLGAAGALEAIVSILTIKTGIIPPTINYENPDPDCDLDYVPNKARKQDVRRVLTNSFGFGGHNGCLAFTKYEK